MSFTLNGIGTTLYGKRDFWPDGSYVTTEWFVVSWIPVFPIRSQRVLPTDSNNYGVYASQSYLVYGRTKPNGTQVLSIYSFVLALAALGGLISLTENPWLAVPIVASLFVPYVLRRKARQRMAEENSRTKAGLQSQPV